MLEKSAVVLAAGDGTRMKSSRPKVMCEVLEHPMLGWVLDALEEAGFPAESIGVVVGNGAELVTEYASKRGAVRFFTQSERKGTGHAVTQALPLVNESGDVLVLCGDAPFIDAATVEGAYALHKKSGNSVTVVSAEISDPTGYGRIIRGADGGFLSITEHKDCTEEQKNIREINSGVYWFGAKALSAALPKLTNNNAKGEFYLTDTVELIRADGGKAGVFTAASPDVVKGANSRRDLLALNEAARAAVIEKYLDNGVEMICTDGVIIGKNVTIGQDTKILPNTVLRGNTSIGENCVVGGCVLENCKVGNGVTLNYVQAFDSEIRDGVKAGPFVHIRPGTVLCEGVKIGDFVEVKGSVIGEKTSIAHLTYIGDSDVGKDVNFGCGCVTANYDGVSKFRTVIGDHAFIGCNTNLIAPVEIGRNATTGAGSTICRNVPDDSLAIERADLRIKEHWEKNKLRKRKI